jgi:hypothetical protein
MIISDFWSDLFYILLCSYLFILFQPRHYIRGSRRIEGDTFRDPL